MSVIKPLPMFEALFTRQMDITPEALRIAENAMCPITEASDLMLVALGRVALDSSQYCVPHKGYTTDEEGFRVHYLIVATEDGAIAVSEHGAIIWSSIMYNNLRRAWRDDAEWAKLERVIIKGVACGIPMHRMMRYLSACTETPQSEYRFIVTAMNELTAIMGNDELDQELDS